MSKQQLDFLTPEEMREFDKAFASLDIRVADRSVVREKILLTVQAAKAKMKANFGGLYPRGNEIGIGPIRANHLGGSATYGFATAYTAAGWNDYMITNMNVLEDHFVCMWELEDTEPVARAQQMAWFYGEYTSPIIDLTGIKTSEYNRVPFPEPIILTEKVNIDADIRLEAAGWCGVRPVGAVVTSAIHLIKKRPA